MFEAARTTASPAATWAIVIVSVVVLAAWLSAVMLADRYQARRSGRWRMTGEAGAASGEAEAASSGRWAGGSLPGADASEIPGEAVHEPIEAQGRQAGDEPVPEGDIPTRVDLPAQRSGEAGVPSAATSGPRRTKTSGDGPAARP